MSQEPKGQSNEPAPRSFGIPAQPNAVRGKASGPGAAPVHTKHDELRLLVNSRHPIITVETPEEERFEQLLLEVAAELGVPMYEWSVTAGLAKYAGAPLQNTDQPELVWRKPGNNCLLDFRAREAFTSHGEFREVKRGRVASLGEIRSTQPLSVTRAEEVHSSRQWAKTRAAPAD